MTRIGNLRQRLELRRPVSNDDGAGGQSTSFETVDEVWAEIITRPASERVTADQLSPRNSFTLTLRYRSDIETGWRLSRFDLELIIIAAADPDGRKRWLRCLCEEVAS